MPNDEMASFSPRCLKVKFSEYENSLSHSLLSRRSLERGNPLMYNIMSSYYVGTHRKWKFNEK